MTDKTQEELERVEKLLIKVFDKHMLPKPYYTLLKDISYDLTHYINKYYEVKTKNPNEIINEGMERLYGTKKDSSKVPYKEN